MDTEVEALGHDWGEPTYDWSNDNSHATAARVCKRDSHHIDAEPVSTTSEVTKQPTCEEKGETTYSATFTNEVFENQTKTVADIDALGHKYGEYKLTKAATASDSGKLTRTCSTCGKKSAKVVPPMVAKGVVVSSTSAEISWGKVSAAERYVVYFASCGKTSMKVIKRTTTNSVLSCTKTGLKSGSFYKFKIEAQRKIDGKWVTISTSYVGHFVAGNLSKSGKFTNTKAITVPKTAVTLKANKTYTIKPGMTLAKAGKKVMTETHAQAYRYSTTDSAIATVSSTGKITAKKAGKCKVYVVGINGVYKAITVTVN